MPLLAQLAPVSNSGLHVIVAGVVLVLTITAAVIGIWGQLRRKPPIEAEFVAKADCLRTRSETLARIGRIEEERKHLLTTSEFRDFRDHNEQQIERLRTSAEVNMREVLDRISELQADMQTSTERRVGELHTRINEANTRIARVEARGQREGPHGGA